MLDALFALLGIIFVLAVLFIVFRAIVLWYFRIDEAIQLLKNIGERLQLISGEKKPPAISPTPVPERRTSAKTCSNKSIEGPLTVMK